MINIDYIMSLLDWDSSSVRQKEGILLAEDIENFNVFIQPCNKKYRKNVWENCAKIISSKTDEELQPYLFELFRWIRDLNWPGALTIRERLRNYEDYDSFDFEYTSCLKCAEALNDSAWAENLLSIKREDRVQYDAYFVEGLEDSEKWRGFLCCILASCDAFSLIFFKYRQNEKCSLPTTEVRKRLARFKLDSRIVNEWPSTQVQNEQKHIYRMNTYRSDNGVIPVFEQVGALWNWDYPDNPMDPCFYKNGVVRFASSSHEQWNELYLVPKRDDWMLGNLEDLGISLVPTGKKDESQLFRLETSAAK